MIISYFATEIFSPQAITILTVCASIATIFPITLLIKVTRGYKELRLFNPSLEVLKNYQDVWDKFIKVVNTEIDQGKAIKIKNIGLDLEKILPDMGDFIRKKLLVDAELKFRYQGLIINPDSQFIKPLINDGSNIQKEYVASSKKKLAVLKSEFKGNLNVEIDIISYDGLPAVHGILVNYDHLFLGFTEIKNGKIFGSDQPYIYMKFAKKNAATVHYFRFFNNWFEYHWKFKQTA